MDTLKKHVDTIIILAAFASAFLWMDGRFNELKNEIKIIRVRLLDYSTKIQNFNSQQR